MPSDRAMVFEALQERTNFQRPRWKGAEPHPSTRMTSVAERLCRRATRLAARYRTARLRRQHDRLAKSVERAIEAVLQVPFKGTAFPPSHSRDIIGPGEIKQMLQRLRIPSDGLPTEDWPMMNMANLKLALVWLAEVARGLSPRID